MEFTKIKFLNWLSEKIASIEDKIDSTVKKDDFIKLTNKVDYASNGFFKDIILEDNVTSYKYVLEINNGVISTHILPNGILIDESSKVEFSDGDCINLQDIIISITYPNGKTEKISDYAKLNISPLVVTKKDKELRIAYLHKGLEFLTYLLPITVVDFNPDVKLVDFNYSDNNDGTYTLTGWKKTLNGEASTEIIIPNNANIKL